MSLTDEGLKRRGMVDERVMFDGWDKERLRDIVE